MAFYLLQVLFGSALLIIAAVLLIVAFVLSATQGNKSEYTKLFGAWGLGFLGLGFVVIALA